MSPSQLMRSDELLAIWQGKTGRKVGILVVRSLHVCVAFGHLLRKHFIIRGYYSSMHTELCVLSYNLCLVLRFYVRMGYGALNAS